MSRPKFSVLLPTYNRAPILPLAIESVLTQTFADFELIISNGGSTDETHQLVANIHDNRIRYFESSRRLSMAENYEFALKQATGEYIVFFSDDDAIVPSALQRLNVAILQTGTEMVVFPFARYYLDASSDGIPANTLAIPEFSLRSYMVNADDDLKAMSGRFFLSKSPDTDTIRPLIGNVVFARRVLAELYSKVDSVFATVPVDGYFITLVLSLIDNYEVLDLPLLAWSQWEKNASISKSKAVREHFEQLLADKTLDQVPLKFALPVNCAANAILTASADIGSPKSVPVDWPWYFVKMYEYLEYLKAEGVEVGREMREFKDVMETQPAAVRDYCNSNLSRKFIWKQRMKKNLIFATEPFRRLKMSMGIRSFSNGHDEIIPGKKHGFSNVLEAAIFLDTQLLERS